MGTIKNRVPIVMAERGIFSIQELADRAGLDYSVARRVARGLSTGITFRVLGKLCEALDADVGDLFFHPSNGGTEKEG